MGHYFTFYSNSQNKDGSIQQLPIYFEHIKVFIIKKKKKTEEAFNLNACEDFYVMNNLQLAILQGLNLRDKSYDEK